MKKHSSVTLLIISLLLTLPTCSSPPKSTIPQNLKAFTKLYGYIKYFHPSDEAAKINWDAFAIYGVNKVKNAANTQELKNVLESLFLPIAPSIQIYETNNKPEMGTDIIPRDTTGYKRLYWQHFGVELSNRSNIYKSIRVNRTGETERAVLFNKSPGIGELITKNLNRDLQCQIPLSLYSDSSGIFSPEKTNELASLIKELDAIDIASVTADDENVRLADIVIAWNVFQHFYPYFDVINTDWDKTLSESLNEAIENKNANEFFDTLRRMVAKLEDGHGVVYYNPDLVKKGLPIRIEWIENQLVITAAKDSSLFQKGDIIKKIDGILGEDALKNAEKLVSGSPQLRRYRALNIVDSGVMGSIAHLELMRNRDVVTVEAPRNEMKSLFFSSIAEFDFPDIKKLDNDIYYVNLATAHVDDFNALIDDLAQARGVIFDWRWDGESNQSNKRLSPVQHIFPHLIKEPVTSAQWHIPEIIYPDRINMTFLKSDWSVQPQEPYFKSNCVFINEPSVVSYGETCMGIIEHYKLAEMVGQTTAGCNGNANFIYLPGKFRIMWTGMKVLKHDGSQHHLIGIEPTYPVKKTIRAVKEGRDEYLEKAVEVFNVSTE